MVHHDLLLAHRQTASTLNGLLKSLSSICFHAVSHMHHPKYHFYNRYSIVIRLFQLWVDYISEFEDKSLKRVS